MPIFSLIAGPNGSGKSTLTEWVDLEHDGLLLDADAIARVMNPSNPRAAAIAAGKSELTIALPCAGDDSIQPGDPWLSGGASG